MPDLPPVPPPAERNLSVDTQNIIDLLAKVNELNIDDLTDKVDDLTDKCNDILDKCNDIFEKVNE